MSLLQVHFRVGGAIGTLIDPKNCPKGDGSSVTSVLGCAGAWALMHITTKATAYLENVWGTLLVMIGDVICSDLIG